MPRGRVHVRSADVQSVRRCTGGAAGGQRVPVYDADHGTDGAAEHPHARPRAHVGPGVGVCGVRGGLRQRRPPPVGAGAVGVLHYRVFRASAPAAGGVSGVGTNLPGASSSYRLQFPLRAHLPLSYPFLLRQARPVPLSVPRANEAQGSPTNGTFTILLKKKKKQTQTPAAIASATAAQVAASQSISAAGHTPSAGALGKTAVKAAAEEEEEEEVAETGMTSPRRLRLLPPSQLNGQRLRQESLRRQNLQLQTRSLLGSMVCVRST